MIDDKDKRLLEVKLDNLPELTIKALSKYKKRLKAVAIESTFNWYWLADALMAKGFKVELVNTAKVVSVQRTETNEQSMGSVSNGTYISASH